MDPTAPRSLLDRLKDGPDSPAWREFDRLYRPLLQHWVRPYLLQPADVDDLAQEVFVVVLNKLAGFVPTGPGAFRAWLRAILAYRLQTFWRKKVRGHAVGAFDAMLAGLVDDSSDLARLWDLEHDRHVVGGLLKAVQPHFTARTWQAFWRTTIGGEPAAAVGTALGLSPNAVFIARSRVLQRLRTEAAGLVDDERSENDLGLK
jgi:RNA polymerase sigma-70 factor (ECF subfamily)